MTEELLALRERVAQLEQAATTTESETDFETRYMEMVKEFTEQFAGEHTNYANTIVLLGFAGAFTLWSSISGRMPPVLFALCGLCLGISVAFFVSWEILNMLRVKAFSEKMAAPNEDGSRKNMEQVAAVLDTRGSRINKHHTLAFALSTIPGALGGLLILGFYIYESAAAVW